MRDHDALARALLDPCRDLPAARARRISGLYASFFLEDPLLHSWCGLAAFVARNVARALEQDTPYNELLAEGNLRIYEVFLPNLLRFRDGVPATSGLEPGFSRLREAGRLARTDLEAARRAAAEGLDLLTVVEQGEILGDLFASIPAWQRPLLRPFFFFRMGWDTAAPVIAFDGTDPTDAAQRIAWLRAEILPRWEAVRRSHMEWLRADCDRNRRDAGLRLAMLPERLATAPGFEGAALGWMRAPAGPVEKARADV